VPLLARVAVSGPCAETARATGSRAARLHGKICVWGYIRGTHGPDLYKYECLLVI
jgi:hypothetical protein